MINKGNLVRSFIARNYHDYFFMFLEVFNDFFFDVVPPILGYVYELRIKFMLFYFNGTVF